MATLNRIEVIDLLGRLGSEHDETVLHAARELNRKIGEAGITWDDLLRLDQETAGSGADREPIADTDGPVAAGDGALPAADKAEAARLIDRLLTRATISESLRADLTEMKRTIADGTFDTMDTRYVRALAKRLGV